MTELMQLYNYTLENRVSHPAPYGQLPHQKAEYRPAGPPAPSHPAENLQPLLRATRDALSSQQSTELEAMFLAALS